MLMGYSRELHLSDCTCCVEHEPGLVIGSIVDHGITACWEIARRWGSSLAEAFDGIHPTRPVTAFLHLILNYFVLLTQSRPTRSQLVSGLSFKL